jgi:predicted metal-dependent HD superfamily phosphohydrolase
MGQRYGVLMGLTERFVETTRSAGADASESCLLAVGAELVARWSEPHRRYHDVSHLAAVLDLVAGDPVLELTGWAHDAVYDPRSPANEERSALLSCGLLSRCGIGAPVRAEVAHLVRLTAGYALPAGAADAGDASAARWLRFADADLAVLARPWPDYQRYAAAVRAEYAHVPDELWRAGRSAVLAGILARPAIYHHQPAWEAPARANLTAELAVLA